MTKSAEEVAKEIQAQIAAQIASVSSLLNNANQEKEKKKAAYRPLLLDNQGGMYMYIYMYSNYWNLP